MNIEYQFEFLSHAMRMQWEQVIKYPDLVEVDEREAIFNVEIAVKSVFDAFHNVYDAIQSISNKTIEFHTITELFLVLSIRNAKHHNYEIKSILFEDNSVFYVDFIDKKSFPCIAYPIKWSDIVSKIQSGKKDLLKYPEVRNYLKADIFENEAKNNGFNQDEIYINIIPIVLMSGKKLVELCGQYIPQKTNSQEYQFFVKHFDDYANDMTLGFDRDYDKNSFKNNIKNIINTLESISEIILDGEKNPYLEEFKYSQK